MKTEIIDLCNIDLESVKKDIRFLHQLKIDDDFDFKDYHNEIRQRTYVMQESVDQIAAFCFALKRGFIVVNDVLSKYNDNESEIADKSKEVFTKMIELIDDFENSTPGFRNGYKV